MDEFYMKRALELAIKGVGMVNPNPMVGAVIVKDNKVIGEGFHEKYGHAHAERNAVKNAVEDIEGATVYVTLEPCAHYGKTPPCVDLLIEKKVRKVVIGMLDPNPLVAGKSIKKLKENNIEVKVGVKEKECRKLNEVFIKYITTKKPFVIMKAGISIDGKIATSGGESKWITSERSRLHSHELRNRMSGIMVGINTVLSDDPSLTYRGEHKGKDPLRIIIDSTLKVPFESKVIKYNNNNTIVACVENADLIKKEKLEKMGVKVIETKSKKGKVDLQEVVEKLGKDKIDSILLEGGGTLNFSALKEGIVDKVRFYIAPKIIGGQNSKNSVSGQGFYNLDDCVNLKDMSYEQMGNEIVVEGYI
ncbi:MULTISPECIES: bifunctional diaminohydroxyphosphoribosylaminopyrimidine deaminase/5-amino-6-(5-phosphoribosylamino)uracil reductase RibD [Clostridium]|uniref:bifunctional diaminohydroxyphosphoribosylaminopyrimidine deaminase/5-amino-6-(5-phosphoribosylamino)uracil reductase RibD n=1 Tax=Clostridium TaxID=1485 RepID=UPI0025795183|nr:MULTISPECIES: bifunctional diaminohydroxyphosphoribosylaminopyrimidine deaminase/5-amino-6-(5-phosphoribosylamino)uracil reductase RibD [Clostridium]MBS4840522.1 bifunctional diaminohydroxyphosphoribosylaminopyrimidine deaminase/5-amino-6-(5-phosphoribosylamino)uracil reductase RibD [Clostridium sp.]MDU1400472.1 bifunctional diaminohydroxyphosphoribosylaminopyrimidine deaminase/5-amino-6-(5-phosphoribosylamino)uracil reductase RibD [Clostridium sp.]MDU1602280.1 bifunctional diaminohydroxyphos